MKVTQIPLFVLLFVLGGMTYSLYTKKDSGSILPQTKLMGQKIPDFKLEAYGGGYMKPEDLKGNYAILNVFASWCVACQMEHSNFNYLNKNYDVDIFGISWRDNPTKLDKYLKEKGNPYKKVGLDPKGELIVQLGTRGIPETYVISPEGKIVYHHPGLLERDKAIEIAEKIKNKAF